MRADARRNRAKILEAAQQVFAAHGTSVSTEEVAKKAGVGIGTVFRHFPTKESLLEAVYVQRLRDLITEAEGLAGAADPGQAFFDFFALMIDKSADKSALADALATAGVDVQSVSSETGKELLEALRGLLERAQAAGQVRSDIGVPELIALLVGGIRMADRAGAAPAVRSRALAVLFDGLKSTPS